MLGGDIVVAGNRKVLAAVLRGEILVNVHCYRASDMLEMLRLADAGWRVPQIALAASFGGT